MNVLYQTEYRIIAAEVLAQLLPLLPEGTPTPKCVVTQLRGEHGAVHIQVLSLTPPITLMTVIPWSVFGGAASIWDERLRPEYVLAAKRLHRKWRRVPKPEVPLLGDGAGEVQS